MPNKSSEQISAAIQRNPFACLEIGDWTIHWTAAEGEEHDSTLETTEENALITTCRLLGGGIGVHYISGPRRIERDEIDLFCVGRWEVRSSAMTTDGSDRSQRRDPPLCSACSARMALDSVVPNLGGLPELWTFICEVCGEVVTIEAKPQR